MLNHTGYFSFSADLHGVTSIFQFLLMEPCRLINYVSWKLMQMLRLISIVICRCYCIGTFNDLLNSYLITISNILLCMITASALILEKLYDMVTYKYEGRSKSFATWLYKRNAAYHTYCHFSLYSSATSVHFFHFISKLLTT